MSPCELQFLIKSLVNIDKSVSYLKLSIGNFSHIPYPYKLLASTYFKNIDSLVLS